MQVFIPATRSIRKGSLQEERPIEPTEEVDHERARNPIIPIAEDIPPMRLDWNPPMNRSASNSFANTWRNLEADQDPLRPLTDPLMSTKSGIDTSTSTPNTTPPLYYGETLDIMSFPFDTLVRQSSETRDHFGIDQWSEILMSDVPTLTLSRSFSTNTATSIPRMTGPEISPPASSSGWLQLHEVITSQVQFVTSQVKSIDFEHFHQAWPFLHVPTFAPEKQTNLLTSALASLLMWMQNINHHHLVPCAINQELTWALMPKITEQALTADPTTDISLPTLQALVITLIYAILGDAPASSLNWAAQWTDIAIFTLRRLGVLDDRWHPEEHVQSADDRWVQAEEMRRYTPSFSPYLQPHTF
ncbi:hypothetical protein N7471_013639 [Penicillium samsonianum]|uniref:uncharacterized protein n=1 Tax=Penicillium samsonianum TaxID=1882272 RepID=UPI0025484D13|nr:uncharacterized protein N7471_013639 [Penicillium samsonianum]KAJ6119019.1 hypothetical protein N7471_013639 [Penicillium samsonianum]